MTISSKGRYAVRIMTELAKSPDACVSANDISKSQNISIKYLEQILAKLTKAKLIVSARGNLGGYKLARKPNEYNIAEILTVTNDIPKLAPCLANDKPCVRKDCCETIGCWETLTKIIYDYLKNITLQDLLDKTF